MGLTEATRDDMLDSDTDLDTPWISLHTDDPGADGSNELAGNGYGRVQGALGSSSGAKRANTGVIEFGPATPAGWTEATHCGAWTLETGGTFKGGDALAVPKTCEAEGGLRFAIGALGVKLT